jgi:hypothetical protein
MKSTSGRLFIKRIRVKAGALSSPFIPVDLPQLRYAS